jgi:signal transduction histidine kinase
MEVLVLHAGARETEDLRAQLEQAREQLQNAASMLILAEQHERKKLAASLHDELAQLLIVAKLKLSTISELNAAETMRVVRETEQLLGEAIRYAREQIVNLAPPFLPETGIVAALACLADRMQQSYGLRVLINDDGKAKPLSEDLGILVLCCARELLVNTVKHAQAIDAMIDLSLDGRLLRMSVKDQGVGFDPKQALSRGVSQVGGFGLPSLLDRVRMFGGQLDVKSELGLGTEITLTIVVTPQSAVANTVVAHTHTAQ